MSYRKKIAHWEGFAETDPLWSILTDPNKKNGKWDIDEFFKTGEEEIDSIFQFLKKEGWEPLDNFSALDFGCGVGRLTRAIGKRMDQVTGVDASAHMIQMAKQYHEDAGGLDFVVNKTDKLTFLDDNSLSFIYSAIVLQHIPVETSYQFIGEFCRALKSGGTLVFQLPTKDIRKLTPFQKFRVWLKPRERLANLGLWKKYHMDMNVYDKHIIKEIAGSQGCEIVGERLTNHTDKAFNGKIAFLSESETRDYHSSLFVIRKN